MHDCWANGVFSLKHHRIRSRIKNKEGFWKYKRHKHTQIQSRNMRSEGGSALLDKNILQVFEVQKSKKVKLSSSGSSAAIGQRTLIEKLKELKLYF